MRAALVLVVGIGAVFGLGLLIGLAGQDPPKRIRETKIVTQTIVPPACAEAVAVGQRVIDHSSSVIGSANLIIASQTKVIRLVGDALLTPVGQTVPQETVDAMNAVGDEVQSETASLETRRPELDADVARYVRAAKQCRDG